MTLRMFQFVLSIFVLCAAFRHHYFNEFLPLFPKRYVPLCFLQFYGSPERSKGSVARVDIYNVIAIGSPAFTSHFDMAIIVDRQDVPN